ncbi:MAG: SRPBCC domain-containing protein [Thermomicrobiales bacterium]|nr:SRPBCC domain-containing protein [Thermomicrobiales bacterium]
MADVRTLTFDQVISFPPEEVWRALTEPQLLARWWAPGDIRPVIGHKFTLDMGAWGVRDCEVLAVKEYELLQYSFSGGGLDTVISWRLVQEEGGTHLFLEHSGFDFDTEIGETAFKGMGSGWPTVLGRISDVLVTTG